MACGVPVVGFAVGGLREVLAGGAGLAVPPKDTEAMAADLANLLSDGAQGRAQAEAGRRAVTARYSPTAHVAELIAIYRRALA
jgi:glycosyltransferase involved in cell wall biosynthesis